MEAEAPLIQARELRKAFRIPSEQRDTVREHFFGLLRPRSFRDVRVLDGVSLDLRRGETLGIMGRNGSGKTTLLRLLCGIFPPDSGSVQLRAEITPLLDLGLGWNPELDAIDNVLLIGTSMGMSLAEARDSVGDVLAFAELRPFAKLQLKHYSSGMSSRLAYSVAFSAVREVLVIDEIFAVGDAGFKERCEERYRELMSAGHSGILVSHDPKQVARFCPRALLLEGGRFLVEGTGEQVADAYLELAREKRWEEKA